ncbi:MAG: hypothetical protein C3F13_02600 [Anaerolineales bacterium]|nr:MAG: hypothetical protein C3F13_02600 [Anaerolineales bacterium]
MSTKPRIAALLILMIIVMVAACVPIFDQDLQPSNTRTPFAEEFMLTVTARAGLQAGSGDDLATQYAQATALSQDVTAQAETEQAAFAATAEAMLPVLQELPLYGVNPLDGQVAWLHNPFDLDLDGYMQYGYANDYPEILAGDFALAADITWDTKAGSSTCGYYFRSDGNKDKPNQFMVSISRFANGTLTFSALVDGNITNTQAFYPRGKDKSFDWLNGSTNRLVVVARGNLIEFFTNGIKIGQVDITKPPPSTLQLPAFPQMPSDASEAQIAEYQAQVAQYAQIYEQMQSDLLEAQRNYNNDKIATFTDGFLGFMSMSEYGLTKCQFNNAWLFLIGRPPSPTPNLTWTRTPTRTATPTPKAPLATWTPTNTRIPSSTITPLPTDPSGTATSVCATSQAMGTPCP